LVKIFSTFYDPRVIFVAEGAQKSDADVEIQRPFGPAGSGLEASAADSDPPTAPFS
jgi:hypothetical protein